MAAEEPFGKVTMSFRDFRPNQLVTPIVNPHSPRES
jgi:hypothetical protein